MSVTLHGHWLKKHRPVASVTATLLESAEPPPLRSPAAAYSGVSSGSPWSDAGESVERWVGERIAGQRQQE